MQQPAGGLLRREWTRLTCVQSDADCPCRQRSFAQAAALLPHPLTGIFDFFMTAQWLPAREYRLVTGGTRFVLKLVPETGKMRGDPHAGALSGLRANFTEALTESAPESSAQIIRNRETERPAIKSRCRERLVRPPQRTRRVHQLINNVWRRGELLWYFVVNSRFAVRKTNRIKNSNASDQTTFKALVKRWWRVATRFIPCCFAASAGRKATACRRLAGTDSGRMGLRSRHSSDLPLQTHLLCYRMYRNCASGIVLAMNHLALVVSQVLSGNLQNISIRCRWFDVTSVQMAEETFK
jgi:hypothetical protein